MTELKVYDQTMQPLVEKCIKDCFDALGWEFDPNGTHSDMRNIENLYERFWCLFKDGELIGMAAVRCIDEAKNIAEMKRLYVLPKHQGKGYGELLFKHALDYTRKQEYTVVRADTRYDRAASRHLMEKYGFKPIESYNQNEFAELYYELELKKMNITYTNTITVEDFNKLHEAVGWGTSITDRVKMALARSDFITVAQVDNQTIGMARVIHDGLQALIMDVIVLPEFQKRGIGKTMMTQVMRYMNTLAQNGGIKINLMTAPDKVGFYEQFGFVCRPNEQLGPGMTMYIKKEEIL